MRGRLILHIGPPKTATTLRVVRQVSDMSAHLLRALAVKRRRLRPYIAKIRYLLFFWIFDQAGRGGSLGRGIRITGAPCIRVSDRVAIRDRVMIAGNGLVSIGEGTAINEECIITAMEKVEIGANVMIAPRVYILDVDHRFDRRDIPIKKQGYRISPVIIDDDAWIGTGAVITQGVHVGRGAIIGANSVVTRDIPDYSIAAGAPAQVIRERPK